MKVYKLSVNGKDVLMNTIGNRSLLDVLREDLKLTGTKCGCDNGTCGVCKVLIDGKAKQSCNVKVDSLEGKEIVTVEGVAMNGVLHPIQESLIEAGAVQCGYCTPAMVISAKGLLDVTLDPTDDEIRKAIRGNLCRCTGYVKIVEGIRIAAKRMKAGERR